MDSTVTLVARFKSDEWQLTSKTLAAISVCKILSLLSTFVLFSSRLKRI